MAFCKNCGTDIGDSNFCPSCGAGTNTEVSTNFSSREGALKEVNRMYSYFSQKGNEYEDYDRTCIALAAVESKSITGFVTYASVASVIGIMIIRIGWLRWLSVPLLLSGIVFGILAPVLRSKWNEKIKELTSKKEKLGTELLEYYRQFPNCLVGFEYTYPSVIQNLMSIIQTGRADSIKEAMNIRINDAHNRELIQLTRKTYNEVHAARQAAEANAAASAATAANTGRSARTLGKFWDEYKNPGSHLF